jgi:DNA-binding NarL/FixJ family response regulator
LLEVNRPVAVKVLIADDHPLIISGIRRALEQGEGIEIVGEAHSATEVWHLIERRRPELVLLDLRMPGVAGTDCIKRIRDDWPDVKVVVLSACSDQPTIDGALIAGASAFVVKSVTPTDIASVIRQAVSGTVVHMSPQRRVADPLPDEPVGPALTERERVILDAVASGHTTAAISKELWVSEHTIKFHLTNIYRKLGVRNRAGAVRYALDNGLVVAA